MFVFWVQRRAFHSGFICYRVIPGSNTDLAHKVALDQSGEWPKLLTQSQREGLFIALSLNWVVHEEGEWFPVGQHIFHFPSAGAHLCRDPDSIIEIQQPVGWETDMYITASLAAKWIAIEEMQPTVWSGFSKYVLSFSSLLSSASGCAPGQESIPHGARYIRKIDWAICTRNDAIQGCFLKYVCSFSLGMLMLCWGIPRGLVVLKTFLSIK